MLPHVKMIYMEKPSAEQATEEKIREIIDSLQCVLTKHDSCAEFIEFKDNTAVIFCGGPCKNCDNRCIEEAIKGRFPDLEVIIS
ncbi:MAG: hypothetical protein A2Y81_04510 [Nitrospirae bacterium RBG_13_43_8]|nr:MAG: hypothetical protein A2Y81_04510 [Nitrospirae bacterium RBG_13_43_8]